LRVPPLGQLTVEVEEDDDEDVEVEAPPVLVDDEFVLPPEPPLELHAARATVPAAMSAASEIRRVRPTGFLHPCNQDCCPGGR
jgi:hypothetical protein